MDEFRKEREAIKHGTPKEKLAYFWDYYKWYAIIGTLILIALISYIYNIATKKDLLMNGILLNVYHTEADSSDLVNGFYEFQNVDTKEEEITLQSSLFYNLDSTQSYQALQVLMTWNSAEQIDFICCNEVDSMTDLAYRGYFTDLSETLNPNDVEKYASRFYYMDEDVLQKRREAANKGEDITAIAIPDPTKPEEMVSPIPIFMKISDRELMQKAYGTKDEDILFGISGNSQHTDMVLRFLEYVME